MLMLLGLLAVFMLLLGPLLRVLFLLARGRLAMEGGKGREQYYRMDGEAEQPPTLVERLNVEYFEGGGLSIAGVVVAPGCHVILCLMALVFLLGGGLLTVLTSLGPAPPAQPSPWAWDERAVAGPLMVGIGLLMLCLGSVLCHLAAVRRRGKRQARSRQVADWRKLI